MSETPTIERCVCEPYTPKHLRPVLIDPSCPWHGRAPTETVEHGEDDIVERLEAIADAMPSTMHEDQRAIEVAAARLRRSAPREVGWQPIDSVPRDGRPVLVWLPDPMVKSHVHAATYHPNVTIVGGQFDFDATCPPTHWMPLPDPPVGPPIGDEEGQA